MIRIYYKDFSGDCSKEQSLAMYGYLPKERQDRIQKLINKDIAKKHIQIGYFLQQVISKELSIPMDCICYLYGDNGKPSLDYNLIKKHLADKEEVFEKEVPDICFNMSHSGRYVVVAVSEENVGIDIEHKTGSYERISKRFFCKEEYEGMKSLATEQEKRDFFLETWTRKEAFLKLIGKGLLMPLDGFHVYDTIKYEEADIHFHMVDMKCYGLDESYKICVCSKEIEYVVYGEDTYC